MIIFELTKIKKNNYIIWQNYFKKSTNYPLNY